MTTWIFQGNPDRFDIEGYLACGSDRIVWMVNQYQTKIKPGDQVFLWRARGSGVYGPAGIIAECLVESPVAEMPDDPASVPFWRGQGETTPRPRVWLKVIRVLGRGSLLRREVIAKSPGLETVGPIRFGNATNFEASKKQSIELNIIWNRLFPED
jgi:hypothetical protein